METLFAKLPRLSEVNISLFLGTRFGNGSFGVTRLDHLTLGLSVRFIHGSYLFGLLLSLEFFDAWIDWDWL